MKNVTMPYKDTFFLWVLDNFRELGHALAGSLVYLLYGVRARRFNWRKDLLTFIVGAAFAIYASKQLCLLFTSLDKSFAGFFMGLMGMRLTEFVLSYDLKTIADAVLLAFKLKK